MAKNNPQNLNPLQLRTLAIFQKLARLEPHVARTATDGAVTLRNLPQPHGDHFHLGQEVVRSRDASGLANPSVWAALQRKGLIEGNFPTAVTLTPAALAYPIDNGTMLIEHSDH